MTRLSLDARILRSLHLARGHLSAEQLAAEALVRPEEIAARIRELCAAGFEIEAHPHFGYRLVVAPDRLVADDLASRLDENCRLAREILVFEKTRSTNDIATQLGRSGAAEGAVVFAETQTTGRGRLGRKWESSSREGLWFSILLRPELPLRAWPRLTIWVAVAVAQGIEKSVACEAMIKWPNDIYIGGKKTVGILIESHPAEQNGFAVAGIGVNVNQGSFPSSLADKAGSLRQVAERVLDRAEIAVAILRQLDALYPKLSDTSFPELLAAAEARSFLRGRWVVAQGSDGAVISGLAESLDENGALQLREANGALRVISAGEISVLSSREF
jgi:BirA family biotin operon repressor/biotin-[acetyl-CoA-carboxylase] ligase